MSVEGLQAGADDYLIKPFSARELMARVETQLQTQAEASRLLGQHLGVDRAYYVEVNVAENHARVNQDYLRGDSPTLVGIHRFTDFGWIVPHLQRKLKLHNRLLHHNRGTEPIHNK
ncbi:hypothetical protein NUACC26_020900 [Scytonema sp. NUACC26]